jgi:hypothetical protein
MVAQAAARLGDDAPLDTERGYHVMMENSIDLRLPLLFADHKFSVTPMSGRIGSAAPWSSPVWTRRPTRSAGTSWRKRSRACCPV